MKKILIVFMLLVPWLLQASEHSARQFQVVQPVQKEFFINVRLQHFSWNAIHGKISVAVMDSVQQELSQWEQKYHLLFDRAALDKKIKSGIMVFQVSDSLTPTTPNPFSLQKTKTALTERRLINGLWQYLDSGYMKNSSRAFYKYDIQGRYIGYVMEGASYSYWYEYSRLLISYNEMDSVMEELYQYHSYYSDEWVNDHRYVYDWDANGNQTYYSYESWDDGAWNKRFEYVWAYDDAGNLLERSHKFWYSNGEISTYWSYRYINTYDENGNLIERIRQSINDEEEWINFRRWTLNYDENNYLVEEFEQSWQNDQWENEYHWTFTNDADGNVIQALGEDWFNEQWTSDVLWTYQYNNQQVLTEVLIQRRSGNTWVNSYRYLYEYDEKGNETLFKSQSWWDNTWHDYYRHEIEYNAAGHVTSVLNLWLNEGIIYHGWRSFYEYDDANHRTSAIDQYYLGDHWANYSKYLYTYYNFGELQGTRYFDGIDTEWKEESRSYNGYENTPPYLPPMDDRPTEAYYSFHQLVFALGDSVTSYSIPDGPDGLYINSSGTVYWYSIPKAGDYPITIHVENANGSAEQSYTLVVLNKYPVIEKIEDTPQDQGGRVFINFRPSIYDVYRRIDQYGIWSKDTEGNWFSVGSVQALRSFSDYSFLAPTLGDSTSTNGQFWSYFKITAHLNRVYWYLEPYYSSPVDSGYSLDNLPPGVPSNVIITKSDGAITLQWDECTDNDFQYFEVYRNDTFLGYTSEPQFRDEHPAEENVFTIFSVDYSGNKSDSYISDNVTAITPDDNIPIKYFLNQNYPNPFGSGLSFQDKPATTIRFGIPQNDHVRIEIFNEAGQLVKVVTDKNYPAGVHKMAWVGNGFASGVYYLRMKTKGFVQVKKMLIIR